VIEYWTTLLKDLLPLVAPSLPGVAALAVSTVVVLLLVHRFRERLRALPAWTRTALVFGVLLGSLVVGYQLVWDRLSMFDDAFISYRYSKNFADGLGLVWNPGERVEGYTNFLWTLLIGLLIRFTPWEAPGVGLVLCLLSYGATVGVIALLGRRLVGPGWLPIAAPLFALNSVAVAYGSTGMETGFCALLVVLGALALVRAEGFRGHALAGLVLIAAALTRPDHGIYYAVGAAVVGGEQLLELVRARRRGDPLPWRDVGRCVLGYSAPFAVYALYVAWKLDYYGYLLPNTYYAKGAHEPWWDQGYIYLALFWIGSHAWIPALMAAIGAFWPGDRPTVRFGAFVVGSLVLFDLYVAKVGGDYMHGRFVLSLVPLVLVGAELLVFRLAARRRRVLAAVAAGLLVGTAWTPELFVGRNNRWEIVDENALYPVSQVWPEIRVDRVHDKLGRFLRDEVRGRGLEPVLCTGSIGMVGYYSGLQLIDARGLTDETVGHGPVGTRSKPGHEKKAKRAYLQSRGVQLIRRKSGQQHFHPERFRRMTRISFKGAGIRDPWQIARYDKELMEGLRQIPGVEFQDFDRWLDGYVADLVEKDPDQVAEDLAWFRTYWFEHNDDPVRLTALERRAEGLLASGAPGQEFVVVSLGDLMEPGGDAELPEGALAGDVLMGNLERVHPAAAGDSLRIVQRGTAPESGFRALEAMGVDLVSLANDHAMDYGLAGVTGTIGRLERRGIAWMGAGDDRLEARRAKLLAGGGLRVAVLATCRRQSDLRDRGWYATRKRGGVWGLRPDELADTVERLRERRSIDFVIVSVDWGTAGGRAAMARRLVEAGVDLVDGHGGAGEPAVELIDGVPVLYDLGRLGHPGSTVARYVFAGGRLDRIELLPAEGEPPELRGGLEYELRDGRYVLEFD